MKMTIAQIEAHQRKHGFTAEPLRTGIVPLIVTSADRIDFFMEFAPPEATSQMKGQRIVQPHFGKPFIAHYKKKELEDIEKQMSSLLQPFRPAAPFAGPLRLVAEWTWEWRASEPKRNRVAGWQWRDTKPDADNAQKLLNDVMEDLGFFTNDSQIADLRIVKQWGDRPGIRITIEQLQNP